MINYYTFLDLEPTATYDEILSACKLLKLRLEAEIMVGDNVLTLEKQLDLVREAQLLLTDADDRTQYNEQLAACPPSGVTDPFAPKHFDFESLRTEDLTSWTELVDWDGELNLSTYQQLLDKIVHLPNSEVQLPILLAAILTPSALANAIPTVHLYGLPGCGKSIIGNFVCKLWGGSPVTGNATFATLRRVIGSQASAIDNSRKYFLNNAFVWEDINPGHLSDENKASLLKSSTYRATSVYKMPKRDTDDEFTEIETFGLRFFSSIYPFFSDLNFIEMKRRMLVIQCEKSSVPVIDMESYDWTGLESSTRRYWETDLGVNARRYTFLRKGVVTALKKSILKPDRQSLCTDLLTTGMTWGVWKSNTTAIQNLIDFYATNDALSIARESPLKSVLINALGDKQGIAASNLKEVVDGACRNGLIDRQIRKGELTGEMRLLGWELNIVGGFWEKV